MLPLRLRPTARAALAALLPLAAAGCLSGTEVTGTNPTNGNGTFLRFVQAVPDASTGVNVAVNGTQVIANFPLGAFAPQAQGQYAGFSVTAPRLTFSDDAAGTTFYDQAQANLAVNTPYTVISYGRAGGAPAATVAVLADTAADSTRTTALLRVFNAVDYVTAGSGTRVDVFVYPAGDARPAAPDVAALGYGAASAYVAEQPAALRVDVFATGTAGGGAAPLFSTTVTPAAGAVRTLVLLDPPAASGSAATGSVLVLNDYR